MDLYTELFKLCLADLSGTAAKNFFENDVLPYVIAQANTARLQQSISAQQREMAASARLASQFENHFATPGLPG